MRDWFTYTNGMVIGNVYIADSNNNRIRMVNASSIITTIAGTGLSDYSGDGGDATSAGLKYPVSVAVDTSGTDTRHHACMHISSLPRDVLVILSSAIPRRCVYR